MLTVSKLAKELNVSVQTIYRVLNSVKQNEKECLTEKIKGVTYFTEFGEKIIRGRLTPFNGVKQNNDECLTVLNSVKHSKNQKDNQKTKENEIENKTEEIIFLRNQNQSLMQELEKEREYNRITLEKEREHSRQQAERIADLAEKMADLTRNNQILLGAEQSKSNPNHDVFVGVGNEESENITKPKKGIFGLFRKSKNN